MKDSTLTISGTFKFKKFEKTFPLSFTSPDYVRVRRRLHYLVQFPLVVACVALLIIRVLSFLPLGLYQLVVEFLGMIIFVAIWSAIRGIAPVEVVIFRNTSGKVQFDLVKEKKQAKEFEDFVSRLTSAIRGDNDSNTTGIQVDVAEADGTATSHSYFCIASLVVGSLWLEISHLAYWDRMGGADSFLGFLVSLLGVGLCVVSFSRVEKLRYLSVIGAALTFVHLFFH